AAEPEGGPRHRRVRRRRGGPRPGRADEDGDAAVGRPARGLGRRGGQDALVAADGGAPRAGARPRAGRGAGPAQAGRDRRPRQRGRPALHGRQGPARARAVSRREGQDGPARDRRARRASGGQAAALGPRRRLGSHAEVRVNALASGAAGAGIIALLELDAASVGPFALSRPVFIGPIVGSLLGSPWIGAGLGVAFEALSLEDLPLGGGFDFSAPVAAGVAVFLAAGRAALPLEAAFLAGLAAG